MHHYIFQHHYWGRINVVYTNKPAGRREPRRGGWRNSLVTQPGSTTEWRRTSQTWMGPRDLGWRIRRGLVPGGAGDNLPTRLDAGSHLEPKLGESALLIQGWMSQKTGPACASHRRVEAKEVPTSKGQYIHHPAWGKVRFVKRGGQEAVPTGWHTRSLGRDPLWMPQSDKYCHLVVYDDLHKSAHFVRLR